MTREGFSEKVLSWEMDAGIGVEKVFRAVEVEGTIVERVALKRRVKAEV